MSQNEHDKILEGHEADGIQELDNGLPKWWLYGFYVTIMLSAIYLFYYNVWEGPDWNFLWYKARGSSNEYVAEMAHAPKPAGVKDFSMFTQRTDAASLATGENIFQKTNLCFTCHRADLGGLIGPNLTDKYWLHGGRFQDILADITHGFPEKGMLKFGNGNTLTDDQLVNVASYVLSKQGSNPPNPKPIDPARDVLFEGK
ncbi:MAG: cbb3-type cytochrome c oxidase N-terminal domain-containing protein [Candidatus Kapaibacterium sp.]